MNYAITGGHGFIGQALAKMLTDRGHIVGLVNRSYLEDTTLLQGFFEGFPADYIIHCAGYGNHAGQSDPQAIYEANVFKTLNLLEATKNVLYLGMVVMGSSSEYGWRTSDRPMRESDLPYTNSFYGASKVAQTFMAKAFAAQYKKPIAVVRPFSVYGPGEAPHRFIPTVIHALKNDLEFPLVYRNARHDWIYIDDFCEGTIQVLKRIDSLTNFEGARVFNLGTEYEATNERIVSKLAEIAGKEPKIKRVLSLPGYEKDEDFNYWRADMGLTSLLTQGWEPKVSLTEGLKKTYDYYE